MAKKKRTRKQKELAEKRKVQTLSKEESALSSPTESPSDNFTHTSEYVFRIEGSQKLTTRPAKQSLAHDYTHLKHDLTKTGILTVSIVIAQIVLFFILK